MTARDYDHPIPAGNVEPDYLGDGAYVSHDTFQIWISADHEEGFHAIALEIHAIKALVAYAKWVGVWE